MRRAHMQATREFIACLSKTAGLASSADVTPLHVAMHIEQADMDIDFCNDDIDLDEIERVTIKGRT